MRLVLKQEVKNNNDLELYIKNNDIEIPEYRTAVIALILDKNDNIILQRRGPESRDEQFMLEDIGGAVEESDLNFKEALKREIAEEVGEDVSYSIDHFVGGFLVNKFDSRSNSYVNWLFLLYKCTYIDGELKINEPGKCVGYEIYKYTELPKDEVAKTTKQFWEYYYSIK